MTVCLREELFIWFTVRVFPERLSSWMCASFPFGFDGGMLYLIVYVPHNCLSINLLYSILSHNLGRSSGHHRWIRNNPFPSWPVFSCPSWAGKVHSCPLFDIVFPPLLLSASFAFSFHLSLCPVGLSLLNQKINLLSVYLETFYWIQTSPFCYCSGSKHLVFMEVS